MSADRNFMLGGGVPIVPVDTAESLWCAKKLREVDPASGLSLSAGVDAARRVSVFAELVNSLAERLPAGVCVVAPPPKEFDMTLGIAAITMLRAVHRVLDRWPDFLEDLWPLMATGSPVCIPQRRTSERDHVWEIVNAAVLSHFCERLTINATGAGADLKAQVCGEPWGVECKVLYSQVANRQIDAIIKGVKQIEGDAAVAKGVVAVNVTDCIDHAPFQQSLLGRMLPTRAAAIAGLQGAVRGVAQSTLTPAMMRRFYRNRDGRPRCKCRAVIYIGQTIACAAGRVDVFTSQFTSLRSHSQPSDRTFADQYCAGLGQLQR